VLPKNGREDQCGTDAAEEAGTVYAVGDDCNSRGSARILEDPKGPQVWEPAIDDVLYQPLGFGYGWGDLATLLDPASHIVQERVALLLRDIGTMLQVVAG